MNHAIDAANAVCLLEVAILRCQPSSRTIQFDRTCMA